MARLRVLKDGVEIQNVDLAASGKASVMLGRAEGADIRLDDRAIGREHAVFLISSNGVAVQKKSKFGKFAVNGAEVAESALKVGDVINIADYQVRVEDGPAGASAEGGPSVANEVTPPQGTQAPPALDNPPDIGAVPEGQTPGLGNPAPDAAASAADGAAALPGMEVPLDGVPAVEHAPDAVAGEPALEAPAGLGEQPTGGVVDGGAAIAEGGDRTAMISTAQVDMRLMFKPGEANVEDFVIKKSEISIGRGSTCDIIIADKKSSRKHLIIKRIGMNFVAQDLGSANGTYINGSRFTEQELAGDDVLRIGETEFKFKAISHDYMQQEQAQEFISPPPEEPPPEEMPADMGGALQTIDPATGLPAVAGAMPGGLGGEVGAIPGIGGAAPAKAPEGPPPKDLIGKAKVWWKKQPPKKQKIYAIGAICLMMFIFFSDDEDPKAKKKTGPKKVAGASGMSGTAAELTADGAFKSLPPEKQQFVVNEYQLALDLYKKQDFEKSLYELNKLHAVISQGYKDSKDIEKYAKKAIDLEKQIADERKRKEDEESMRKALQELVAKAQAAFDAGKDDETKDLCARVLEKDPENPTVLRLRQQMEERENQKKAAEDLAREKEFQRKQHESLVKEGHDLLDQNKYYEVMEKMDDAIAMLGNDRDLLKEAEGIVQSAKDQLKGKTQPHLDAAKSAFDGGDFQKARTEYYAALAVDYKCTLAKEGIAHISEITHERSRKIYVEAEMAESVSDYKMARDKYKECLDSAVKEDNYYGRCFRKYKRFELIDRVVASAGPASAGAAGPDPSEPKLTAPTPAPSPEEPPVPEPPPAAVPGAATAPSGAAAAPAAPSGAAAPTTGADPNAGASTSGGFSAPTGSVGGGGGGW